jgi:AsmA protein
MKIVMILVGVLLIVVVAVVLLPFLIDLNQYQDRYRPLIEEALNRKVELKDIRLTIVPRLGARMAGFTVMDDPSFSRQAFASLASLDVGVRLLPLLRGRLEVEEIVLAEPVITVIKNKEGVLNVASLGKGAPVPSGAPSSRGPAEGPLRVLAILAVDQVSIKDGRMTYRDDSKAAVTEYTLEDLDVAVRSLTLGEMARLHVAATIQPSRLPLTIEGAAGPLSETLDFDTIDMRVGLGKMDARITGRAVGKDITLAIDAPSIKPADIPVALPLTKPVEITNFKADVEIHRAVDEQPPADPAVKSVTFSIVSDASVIDVAGSLTGGKGSVTATAPLIRSEDLPVALPLVKPVALRDLRIEAETVYPSAEPLMKAITVKTLRSDVAMGSSVVHVNGTMAGGEGHVTAAAPVLRTADLPASLPLRKSVEAKDVKLVGSFTEGQAVLESMSLTVFGGRLTSRVRAAFGTDAPSFDGALSMQGIQLAPLVDALSDKVTVSGTATSELVVKGRGYSQPQLASALTGAGAVAVKDGKVEGVNVLQEAVGLLQAAGVTMDPAKATVFSSLTGTFAIRSGIVAVERLALDSQDVQGNANGTIGFDHAVHLKATLTLSEAISKQIKRNAPAVKLVTAGDRVMVPMIVTGTIESPSYGLDAKAVAGAIQERVKEEVRDVVSDVLKGEPLDLEKGKKALRKLFGE